MHVGEGGASSTGLSSVNHYMANGLMFLLTKERWCVKMEARPGQVINDHSEPTEMYVSTTDKSKKTFLQRKQKEAERIGL